MPCCGFDLCEEPCLECDCQAACDYLSKYGEKLTNCIKGCDTDQACRDNCFSQAASDKADCLSACPPEAVIPDIAPLVYAWSVPLNSGFPSVPAHFDNENNQAFLDCGTTCTDTQFTSVNACDDDFGTCEGVCIAAGDPGLQDCLNACASVQINCWNDAFGVLSDCYTTCLSGSEVSILSDSEQVNGITTHCQGQPGAPLPPGDDAPPNTPPSESDTCARCLRLAARAHYLKAYPSLIAAQVSASLCAKSLGDCVADSGNPDDPDCLAAEWPCLLEASAVLANALLADTREYAEQRAQCLTRWMRYDSTVDDPPSDQNPRLKLPICYADILAAFPITKAETDRTQRGGWMRAELEANGYRLDCQGKLYECVKLCEYDESPSDFFGAVTCIGLCNLAANRCQQDINRDRIEDRIRTARLYLPRPGVKPSGDPDPVNNQPYADYAPHDYAAPWCLSQLHGLYDYCVAAVQLVQSSCMLTCCSDPDCETDCLALGMVDDGGTPCLDAFQQCVNRCDPSQEGSEDCRLNCFKILEMCIIISPLISLHSCHSEIQHWDSRLLDAPKTGCSDLFPDCPDFTDDFYGGGGTACLMGDSWDYVSLAPEIGEFPCD